MFAPVGRRLLPALVAGLALFGSGSVRAQADKHPHMHHALFELRETRTQLKEASHDFGGHREKALKAVDAAIRQLDLALRYKGDTIKAPGRDKDRYKKYPNHPHIRHAIHELKEARRELKESSHDFGGHRERALRDVNYAIEQLELALKHANKK